MPRYLAIDAELGHLHLAEANIGKGRLRVEHAATLAEDALLTPANAAAIGARLKDRLAALNIAPAPVLFSLGRDKVILKDAKFPPVAPHEEPALVRFQTIKELAESPDDLVIDYCHVPSAPGEFEKRALVVVLRREQMRAIQLMCDAAGLKLAAVTARPFATATALEDAARTGAVPLADGSAAILTRGEKWGEFTVTRGGQVVFSRALSGPSLNAEVALVGEVKRNIALFNGQSGQVPIQALYVAEATTPGWSGRLREGLNVPVHTFDALAGTEALADPKHLGNFTALVGLMSQRGRSSELPINFVQPREPKPPADPNTKILTAAVAVVVLAGLGMLFWGIAARLDRDNKIDQLRAQKGFIDSELTRLEPQAKRIAAIDEWTSREVVWLDEFYELTAKFPDHEKTRLIQFTGEPLPPAPKNAAENKYVGRMTMKVITEDGKSVDQLLAALVKDPHYRVAPKEPKGSTGFRGARFNQSFGLRADVMHRDPKNYLSVLTAKRPPKKSGRGDAEEALDLGLGFEGSE